MANRESLKILQARLAQRLQSAQAEGPSVEWLGVRSAGRNFLFPLGQSGEICPVANLQRVPYVRPWFRGVMNIRGGLFGVVNWAAFEAEDSSATPNAQAQIDTSVVTLNPALDVNCAIEVDSLAGLKGSDAFTSVQNIPSNMPAYFGKQFLDVNGETWQEINLRLLSRDVRFLSVNA